LRVWFLGVVFRSDVICSIKIYSPLVYRTRALTRPVRFTSGLNWSASTFGCCRIHHVVTWCRVRGVSPGVTLIRVEGWGLRVGGGGLRVEG